MSVFNPASPTAAASPPADIQHLVALLGSLLPLLLRFQTLGQPLAGGLGSTGFGNVGPGFAGVDNLTPSGPTLDHQAAASLAGDITADALRNLSAYLEVHAGRHGGLDQCVPVVTQAAQAFAARDYARALNLIWQAYRMIAMVRATDPQLPPVRAAGAVVPPDQSTSIH